MLTEVILPKQGLQMTEGTLVAWHAAEGDRVEKGLPLFDMETDKVTLTIDCPADGVLLKILHGEGETVPVARVIALIGDGADELAAWQPGRQAPQGSAPAPAAPPAPAAAPAVSSAPAAAPAAAPAGSILITPRARTVAAEKGIDPAQLTGSGPDGRIIERDVLAAAARPAPAPAAPPAGHQGDIVAPLAAAPGLPGESMVSGPAPACHRIRVDMGQSEALRAVLQAAGRTVSDQSIIALAAVRALTAFPRMNAWVMDGQVVQKHAVNLGIAVAAEQGLSVPVVPDAGGLGLPDLHEAAQEKASAAREGRLTPEDFKDATFALMDLGMYDIESSIVMVRPPQAGILAMGRVEDTPVARAGQVVIRPMVTLTLTYDHRAVDSALAAQFLQRVKDLLESPALLLTR